MTITNVSGGFVPRSRSETECTDGPMSEGGAAGGGGRQAISVGIGSLDDIRILEMAEKRVRSEEIYAVAEEEFRTRPHYMSEIVLPEAVDRNLSQVIIAAFAAGKTLGIDINYGQAVLAAVLNRKFDCLQLIVKQASLSPSDLKQALELAAREKQPESLRLLLPFAKECGDTITSGDLEYFFLDSIGSAACNEAFLQHPDIVAAFSERALSVARHGAASEQMRDAIPHIKVLGMKASLDAAARAKDADRLEVLLPQAAEMGDAIRIEEFEAYFFLCSDSEVCRELFRENGLISEAAHTRAQILHPSEEAQAFWASCASE